MQTISTHRLIAFMSHKVCNKVVILLTIFFLRLLFNKIYITCTVPREED